MSFDLKSQLIKVWKGNFDECVLSTNNPYNKESKHYAKIKKMSTDDQKMYIKKSVPQQVSVKIIKAKDVQNWRRSLTDNRMISINYYMKNEDGASSLHFINIMFSSVFKVFQFLELLAQS